jgi:N-methylhydantoinase B
MAHWLDIGGALGGMTTDIFAEGLQIPILKYQDRGVVNAALVNIIRQNVRLPSRAMGDLRAQVTAVKTGERRFLELIDRYGRDAVLGSIAVIMDHSEAMARGRTRTIPDGVYEAESYMDDDGIEVGKPVPIKVRVIVHGSETTVDLSEVSKQVRGFYNSGITTGHACAQVAYKCLTSPADYPINDGSFRSLKTIVPPGRIVSATRPAPMRWWMTYPMTIVDTIFKALAPVIPDRVIAGHHADLLIATVHGINLRTSEFFIANFGPLGGGWGAKRNEDGVSATVAINDGDTHNSPNEQAEVKFPLVVERYALVPDSGGAGLRRGGLGVERVVRARVPMTMNTQVERAHCRPWGLAGGLEGTGNQVALRLGGQWKTDFPNAKVLVAMLKSGDAFLIRSGGGGGYGEPLDRPVAQVAEDVRQGYVTVKAAAEHYGVVLDSDTLTLNAAATERLRSARRSVSSALAAPHRSA